MVIIYNKLIPFKGFISINLFGLFFVREELKYKIDDVVIRHESIHTEQIKELLYIGFYIWYLIEWLIRVLFVHPFSHKAYKTMLFEVEANKHENDEDYLKNRKHYNWLWKR